MGDGGGKGGRDEICVAGLRKIEKGKNERTVVAREKGKRRGGVGGNILVDMAMMLKLRNPASVLKEPKTARDAKTHAKTHDTVLSGWDDESRMSNVYQKCIP